jgi:hypothetical protein
MLRPLADEEARAEEERVRSERAAYLVQAATVGRIGAIAIVLILALVGIVFLINRG